REVRFPAELSYITRGFTWSASYNIVANAGTASASEPMGVVGWITMQNNSGVDFPAARIQLMAGNVAKIRPPQSQFIMRSVAASVSVDAAAEVTQQNLDEFHLYDLNRTTSLDNGQTKQVQFLNATAIPVTRLYEYEATPEFLNYNGGGGG